MTQKKSQSKKTKSKLHTKIEFSKILCVVAVTIFSAVAIFSIVDYYVLVRLAIDAQTEIVPDAALPIAGITSVIAAVVSYCLYQFGLKNSRNKYGIDEDGQPFAKFEEEDETGEE